MISTGLDVFFLDDAGGLPTPDQRVIEKLMAMLTAPATDREVELDRRVAAWRMLAGDALPFDQGSSGGGRSGRSTTPVTSP